MSRALILVDFQQGFDDPCWGPRNNPDAETEAAGLLARWRKAGAPVFHIEHHSTTPGSPLNPTGGKVDFKPEVTPLQGELVLTKSVNSAFIGTGLEAYLHAANISAITLCGLTTPHCVSTTARMAANLGFDVDLAHDACAAVAANADASWRGGTDPDPEAIHMAALDHLNGEFATIRSAKECAP